MSAPRRVLSLLICVLSLLSLAADELPPRAVARLGDYRFYHGERIACLAISHDGRRVATGDNGTSADSCKVIVWDKTTGAELRRWQIASGLSCLALSPDGKQLAAGCGTSKGPDFVFVYAVETGKRLFRLGEFKQGVIRVQYSLDGSRLHVSEGSTAGFLRDPALSTWDTTTGQRHRRWEPPEVPPRETEKDYTTWTVQEGRLAADEKMVLWEIIGTIQTPKGAVDFSTRSTIVRAYDATTNKPICNLEADFLHLILFPDSKRLVLSSEPPCIRDFTTGKVLRRLKETSEGEHIAAISPDGRRAVIAAQDGFRLYDLETEKFLSIRKIGLPNLRSYKWLLSGDGKTLLVASPFTVRVFDLVTGQERAVSPGHRLPICSLWFSPDGTTLLSRCQEIACEWSVGQAKEMRRHGSVAIGEDETLQGWSPDERLILVKRGSDAAVSVRETKTGKLVRTFEDLDDKDVRGAVFSPKGDKAALLCPQHEELQWFDVTKGKRLGWIARTKRVGPPVFSPDSRLLVWAKTDNTISVADVATGQLLLSLGVAMSENVKRPREAYSLLAFSGGSDYLVVSSDFRQDQHITVRKAVPLRMFHVRSGKEMASFFLHPENEGDSDCPICIACSPNGRLLAVTEEYQQTIRVVEIASGRTRLTLSGHRGTPTTLAFSHNGQLLASGGEDNVIYLWDITGARTPTTVQAATEKDLATAWTDLAGTDAVRAGEALAALIRTPQCSVPFLKERLRPITATDEKRVARLIADLDADAFETRETASRELAHLEERAEKSLRRALKDGAPPEAKRRLEELLDKLDRHSLTPEMLRNLRAVEALEHIGTPESRSVLEALARGSPEARLTREAKASLRRLAKE